jgi:hypothetical protein
MAPKNQGVAATPKLQQLYPYRMAQKSIKFLYNTNHIEILTSTLNEKKNYDILN